MPSAMTLLVLKVGSIQKYEKRMQYLQLEYYTKGEIWPLAVLERED